MTTEDRSFRFCSRIQKFADIIIVFTVAVQTEGANATQCLRMRCGFKRNRCRLNRALDYAVAGLASCCESFWAAVKFTVQIVHFC